MSLRAVNLNLLPVLQALLRERSVSRAAAAVGLSQPAVSKALAQLRGILGDALLVRGGREWLLTPRAEALIGEVDALCLRMEDLWRPVVFEPASTKRDFVILSADYAAILFVPRLAPVLAAQAPGVSMRFTDPAPGSQFELSMADDFIIAPRSVLGGFAERGGRVEPLFWDEFVPIVRNDHCGECRPGAAATIDDHPHIAFWAGDRAGDLGDGVQELVGCVPPRLVAAVQNFASLPLLAVMTGAVAVAPRRLAEMMAEHLPIRIVDEGAPRARVEMSLGWSARYDDDLAHAWFRRLVIETMRDDRFAGPISSQ